MDPYGVDRYNIDGHCVCPLIGTIVLIFYGVVFDHTKIEEFIRG